MFINKLYKPMEYGMWVEKVGKMYLFYILVTYRRRKRGAGPPNFTHCLHNELHLQYCNILDIVPHLCQLKGERKNVVP